MNSSRILKASLIVVLAVILGAGVWFAVNKSDKSSFCFDFSHNMQFGDRKVAHPVNQGKLVGGIAYYLPEVPALQAALQRQGFTIDKYETTGGQVYAGPFYGPATRAAVMAFQKKYRLSQTGEVDDATIDKLHDLYACPHGMATSTVQEITVSTTTIGGKAAK